jgi:predicted esterase
MKTRSAVALFLVSALAAWAQTAAPAAPAAPAGPDARVKPGAIITVEYPDMGKSLAYDTPRMVIYIPSNYDPARQHPLFLWYNGGDGVPGVGEAMQMTGEKDFVCVSLSLFKPNPPTPEQRKVDQWAGLYLESTDGPYNWERHKKMLADLHRMVPNLHSELCIAGGFSNGAHIIAYLLNTSKGEFQEQFKAFLFCEGGHQLSQFKAVAGRPLMIVWGEKSQEAGALKGMVTSAKAAKAILETFEMPGVGHDMPKEHWPRFGTWVREAALPGLLRMEFDKAGLLLRQNDNPGALRLIVDLEQAGVASLAADIAKLREAVEKRAANALETIMRAKTATEKARQNKIKRLEEFIPAWTGTAAATEADKALSALKAETPIPAGG